MNADPPVEAPIEPVRGTEDRLPRDHARLARLEAAILDCCRLAGYDRLATPILEPVELHERKSGAGIVGKLYQVAGPGPARACLRPELTAGIVRAYAACAPAPALPWRVSHSGPAFRREDPARPDRLREFHQVGVERLGDSGPYADAEVIWLACASLAAVGIERPAIRVGHVGLILEILDRSGLPSSVRTALIETLSAAAAEGGDVGSIGRGLDHFEGWLRRAGDPDEAFAAPGIAADAGVDRLFRTLVPDVTGRRSGAEVVARLRRKWDLGRDLLDQLGRVREQVRALADLKGPPPAVLDRLARDFEGRAPRSVAALRTLFRSLADHGIAADSMVLDLGLGRGIGFYSQMIFDLTVETPDGTVELGGGGRYDGLARAFGSDRDDRGAGFAFGLERIDQVLSARAGDRADDANRPRAFLVIPATEAATAPAVGVAARIRAQGGRAILESGWAGASLADRARALAARWSVVVQPPGPGGPGLTLLDHERGAEAHHAAGDLPRVVADLLREVSR